MLIVIYGNFVNYINYNRGVIKIDNFAIRLLNIDDSYSCKFTQIATF